MKIDRKSTLELCVLRYRAAFWESKKPSIVAKARAVDEYWSLRLQPQAYEWSAPIYTFAIIGWQSGLQINKDYRGLRKMAKNEKSGNWTKQFDVILFTMTANG